MSIVRRAIIDSVTAAAVVAALSAGPVHAQEGQKNPATGATTPPAQGGQASQSGAPTSGATGSAGTEKSDSPQQAVWFQDLYAPDLIGKDVVDASGDEIAQVDDIVSKSDNGKLFAVLATGGLFGLGETEVAVSLDELGFNPGADKVVAQALSEASLETMSEYDKSAYQSVNQYQKLGNVKN